MAKWIYDFCDNKRCKVCSACGSIMAINTQIDYLAENDNRYCYWCGEKMDGEQSGCGDQHKRESAI